ncbi:hypothetical protein K435DRAFT_805880 [Dendrothele bispora CBS 962.96]|uniref:Uncharacterized protein n=1 Tax=Dendrothele bispora (strain CBS 962.96) TaxID=1314807 RepID=A0A4S8L9I0_DENBC|nr:hypothetical protein K435DRAFT_805880 [Dendrothele bispora CBS 962.96]
MHHYRVLVPVHVPIPANPGPRHLIWKVQAPEKRLFIIPLIVHQELSQYPDQYPSLPVKKNAVVMVITPTKGLANSIIYVRNFGQSRNISINEISSTWFFAF